MATEPHPEGLDWLSGYCIPSKEPPEGYKEFSDKVRQYDPVSLQGRRLDVSYTELIP